MTSTTTKNWRTPAVVLLCRGMALTVALGIAGAAGSFGQFVMLRYGQMLINHIGWNNALLTIAMGVVAAILNWPIDDRQVVRPVATSTV